MRVCGAPICIPVADVCCCGNVRVYMWVCTRRCALYALRASASCGESAFVGRCSEMFVENAEGDCGVYFHCNLLYVVLIYMFIKLCV